MGQELRNYTTRECAKVRGDFIVLFCKEDEKVNELVGAAQSGGVIAYSEAHRIKQLGPFPKLA